MAPTRWFVMACMGVLLLAGCAERPAALPVRLGIAPQPTAALMTIARAQRYFEAEGLAPTYVEFPSGKRAIDEGLQRGSVDVVSAADIAVVSALLSGQSVSVLASISKDDAANRVVASRRSGISTVEDLAGRRVATQRHSAVHYFLDQLLAAHRVPAERVGHVFLPVEDLAASLIEGRADAIAMREPVTSQAVTALGEDAVVFEAPGLYRQYELLVAPHRYAREQSEVLRRVLRALLRAERYVRDDREGAAQLLAGALNMPLDAARAAFARQHNRIDMPQGIIAVMEHQTAWLATELGRAGQRVSPLRILEALTLRPLLDVRPAAVTLIENHAEAR